MQNEILKVDDLRVGLRPERGHPRPVARTPTRTRSSPSWAATAWARRTLVQGADRHPARRAGTIVLGGQGTDAGKEPFERVADGLAYVPQGRMIFPTLTVEDNIKTGLRSPTRRRVPAELYKFFPVLGRDEAPPRRQPVGRPAAAAGHRARAGQRPQGAAARRADRGHPALDHQGAGRDAEADPRPARPDHRGVGAGAQLRAGDRRPRAGHRSRPHHPARTGATRSIDETVGRLLSI